MAWPAAGYCREQRLLHVRSPMPHATHGLHPCISSDNRGHAEQQRHRPPACPGRPNPPPYAFFTERSPDLGLPRMVFWMVTLVAALQLLKSAGAGRMHVQ